MFGLSHSTVEVWSAGDVLLRKLLSVSRGPGIFLNNISSFDFHWWRAQPQMSKTSYTISQLAHNQIISLSIQRKTFRAKNIFFHLSTTFCFYLILYNSNDCIAANDPTSSNVWIASNDSTSLNDWIASNDSTSSNDWIASKDQIGSSDLTVSDDPMISNNIYFLKQQNLTCNHQQKWPNQCKWLNCLRWSNPLKWPNKLNFLKWSKRLKWLNCLCVNTLRKCSAVVLSKTTKSYRKTMQAVHKCFHRARKQETNNTSSLLNHGR